MEGERIGVNAIFLWAPYEHRFPKEGETIVAHTANGPKELELGPCVHVKDYLKPDPERGSEREFVNMINTAHALGMKVIAQLQVSLSTPGDFIYERHPEWLLQSIYGKPALLWPWAMSRGGFRVNKAHPELIRFVTDVIVPHWIKRWGVDGIYLDSPSMAYCDLHIKDLCREVGCVKGAEPLTPIDGYFSPEPLVKAMRQRIDELEEETGRDLIFAGETTVKTWRDMPDELIRAACRGKFFKWMLERAFQ